MFDRITLLVLIGAIFLPGVPMDAAHAQSRDYFRLSQQYQQSQVYVQSILLPRSEESGTFGLTFRIPHTALVFTKTPREDPRGGFLASVEVAVEVFQEDERVETKLFRTRHSVNSYEATQARTQDLSGALWFDLPPGEYSYRFEITDRNTDGSGVPRRPQDHPIVVPEPGDAAVHEAILARDIDSTGSNREVVPQNMSGDFMFGTKVFAVVPMTIPRDVSREEVTVRYGLRQLSGEEAGSITRRRETGPFRSEISTTGGPDLSEKGSVIRRDSLGIGALFPIERVGIPDSSAGPLSLHRASSPEAAELFALILDLEGMSLSNELYALDVRWTGSDESSAERTTYFAAHWRDMPVSLYDLDVAIDHLSYIADDETIDWIEDGPREERFRAFWKKRDPSPDTPYNELMAEYYDRVDYAADEFRTGRSPVPDGLQSARARIYIVNGPPQSRERMVPRRGIVREVWTYDDGRTFVFEASSGFDRFRLVDEKS